VEAAGSIPAASIDFDVVNYCHHRAKILMILWFENVIALHGCDNLDGNCLTCRMILAASRKISLY
jgi:hypothetical protein